MPGGAHENMKAWAPEEDQVILDMHATEGPKWSKIVQQLPGRTVSSVRNRWQRIEKGRKLREAGKESKNRCHACGQLKRGHVCYAKLQGGPQVTYRNGQPDGISVVQPVAPLRPTRSSERIRAPTEPNIKVEGEPTTAAIPAPPGPRLSVDVGLAAPDPQPQQTNSMPWIKRTNTSFFKVTAGMFSPSSRDMINAWADSPKGNAAPITFQLNDAPPALQRYASGEMQEPKVTRSLTSFLNHLPNIGNIGTGQENSFVDEPEQAPVPPNMPTRQPSLSTMMEQFVRDVEEKRHEPSPDSFRADSFRQDSFRQDSFAPPIARRRSSRLALADFADIF